jgi:hypothetical protein
LEGEDPAQYRHIAEMVRAAVRPTDIIEEFYVRDIIDLQWDIFRYRRLSESLVRLNRHQGLRNILEQIEAPTLLQDRMLLQDRVDAWTRRAPSAIETVGKTLAAAGLTMADVSAATMELKLAELERVNDLIASAEARRASVIREAERRRSFAQSLRDAVAQVEDADFSEVGVVRERQQPGG